MVGDSEEMSQGVDLVACSYRLLGPPDVLSPAKTRKLPN
jgi:hypothetical protein